MSEGDSAEIGLEGKAEGKGSFGSSTTGGFGAKGNVTLGHSESLKRSVAKKDGKIVITISAGETTTAGGGASVSYGAAGGGYSGTATDTAGQSVTFTLNPDDPAYQQHFDAIANASSIESLRRLAASRPELVGSSTTSSEEGYTGTTSASVGPASLELTDTHSYSESTTTDKTGTTRSFSGSSGGGAAASVAGGPKVSYTEKDTVATKVGPDKKASGDSSTATSETDLSASAKNLAKKLSDSPGETVQGLFTGGAKVMQERTEVAGLKLSDADFETIAATAQDPKRWDNAAIGTLHTSSLVSWRRLARSIAQVNGDRAEIGRLLARFAQENNDAAKAVNHVVRPAGTAAGGARYEWPGDLAAEKAAYESLVAGDPTAPAADLETGGKHKEALDLVNGALPKIDALVKAMQAKRDKFSDEAALAEMLAAAATRRGDVARRAATLRHQMAAAGRSAELPSADVTTVPTPEQQKAQEDIDREGAKAELEGMQASLNAYLEKQTTAFGIVQAEQAKAKAIFGSPDVIVIAKTLTDLKNNVYPQWDETLKKARDAAKKAGVDPSAVGPVPAKGWCNELNKITFGSYFL